MNIESERPSGEFAAVRPDGRESMPRPRRPAAAGRAALRPAGNNDY